MIIENKAFVVRENLWSALSHLQLEDKDRVLWIDAVCINQQDLKERNHQVNQMGRIYSEAQRVVVWLGLSDNASLSAFGAISKAPPIYRTDASKWLRSIGNNLETMKSFWTRGYWGRLWIIQELVLAANILIQCGTQQVKWDAICNFFEHIDENARYSHISPIKAMATEIRKTMPARLYREWRARQRNQMSECYLYDLCLRYLEAKCTDPRDKIFGLLSFAAGCCKEAVPVDYSLSRYEICGLVLLHHTLAHTYDEGHASLPRSTGSSELAKHTHTPIVKSAQIFQQALGVTKKQCPTSTIHDKEMESPIFVDKTPERIQRRFSLRRFPTFASHVGKRTGAVGGTNWLSKLDKLSWKFGQPNKQEKSPGRVECTAERMEEAPMEIEKAPISVVGNVRGRITHLSPPFWDHRDFGFEWTGGPHTFMAGDYFITSELERIKQSLVEAESARLLHHHFNGPAIAGEMDLVSANVPGQSRAIFPADFDLPNPRQGSSTWGTTWSPVTFLGLLQHIWIKARKAAHKAWLEEEKFLSTVVSEDCRVAIEENGFICFAPRDTQIGDLVCMFLQSDVVAIVRKSEDAGQIVGRAISFLTHPANTPLRNYENWPSLDQVQNLPVHFELDISTLQMLTRASSTAENQQPSQQTVSQEDMATEVSIRLMRDNQNFTTVKSLAPKIDDRESSFHYTIFG